MSEIWRNYQMNVQQGMPVPAIGCPLQIQGMDALLMYLQLPTHTRSVFELGMAAPLFSKAQDEQQENPILLLKRCKEAPQQLLPPTGKEGQQALAGLLCGALQQNDDLLPIESPNV
jgi:hypothetical protein